MTTSGLLKCRVKNNDVQDPYGNSNTMTNTAQITWGALAVALRCHPTFFAAFSLTFGSQMWILRP